MNKKDFKKNALIKKINGPIEVKENYSTNEPFVSAPQRNRKCQNYETCLNLVASLDWDGFDCTYCTQNINEQLIWRAKSAQRKDLLAKKIFPIPEIKCFVAKSNKETKKVS